MVSFRFVSRRIGGLKTVFGAGSVDSWSSQAWPCGPWTAATAQTAQNRKKQAILLQASEFWILINLVAAGCTLNFKNYFGLRLLIVCFWMKLFWLLLLFENKIAFYRMTLDWAWWLAFRSSPIWRQQNSGYLLATSKIAILDKQHMQQGPPLHASSSLDDLGPWKNIWKQNYPRENHKRRQTLISVTKICRLKKF